MSDFNPNSTQLQTQLAKKYFDLSPAIQKIIQLFSVIYAPIDKNSFLSCLSQTAALDEKNRPWTTNTLNYQIEKLVIAVLLVKENKLGPECHPLLTEIATRHAIETGKFEILMKAVEEKLPIRTTWNKNTRIFYNLRQCIREIRIGLYCKDLNFINKQIEDYQNYSNNTEKIVIDNIFEQICNNPFDADWFNTLPKELYERGISSILFNSTLKLADCEDAFMMLDEECCESGKYASDYLNLVLTEQFLLQGDTEEAQDSLERISEEYQNNTAIYRGWLSFLRGENEQAIKYYTDALKAIKKATGWLAMESAELLSRLKPSSNYKQQAEALREDSGIQTIVDLIQPQAAWEMCLNALANLQKQPQTPVKPESQMRLAWFITFNPLQCDLQAKEQKVNAKGEWSKGRPIALKRLSNELSEFDYVTPQDMRVCSCIEAYNDGGYYGKIEYNFSEKAILALIGHPVVFWENTPNVRVEIVKGEPELLVKKEKQGRLTLEFSPKLRESQNIMYIQETPTRLKVIEIKAEHRRITEILGKDNILNVPAIAEKQVLAAINAVSGIVTVHSDIGGGLENAEEVPAQTLPHIHLLPANSGLKITLLSRPFTQGGPYFRPGAGGETVIAEIEGKRLQTRRNLAEEKQLAQATIAACPTLTQTEEQDGEWAIEEAEDCLELLLELQTLGNSVVMAWPEGEKLRVSHNADLKDFNLSIQRQQDWFAATGELKLNDDLVLDMQQLLALLEKTPSRFIPLGDGQFLALTQAFRKRLDELRMFSEKHGKGMRFHPLATLGLEDFVDEVGKLKADKHWKEHIQKLKEVQDLKPELPSTFQAELRDYQMDGFCWLARLAHWGVGACLADQMGLGKTVQALAVILVW